MPLYEYRCTVCSHQFEQRRAFGDHAGCCPECGGVLRQVFGTFMFNFKPRGWKPYETGPTPGEEYITEEYGYG